MLSSLFNAQVAKWEEKGGYIETGRSEDVEARKLKHLTTKPCPKCGVRIEKSGGCPVSFSLSSPVFLLNATICFIPSCCNLRYFTAYDMRSAKLQIPGKRLQCVKHIGLCVVF